MDRHCAPPACAPLGRHSFANRRLCRLSDEGISFRCFDEPALPSLPSLPKVLPALLEPLDHIIEADASSALFVLCPTMTLAAARTLTMLGSSSSFRGNTSVLVRIVREPTRPAADADSPDHDDARSSNSRGGGGGGSEAGAEGRQASKRVHHVQIDTGKTWREGVIRWFPR